jgi:hypothetical protein
MNQSCMSEEIWCSMICRLELFHCTCIGGGSEFTNCNRNYDRWQVANVDRMWVAEALTIRLAVLTPKLAIFTYEYQRYSWTRLCSTKRLDSEIRCFFSHKFPMPLSNACSGIHFLFWNGAVLLKHNCVPEYFYWSEVWSVLCNTLCNQRFNMLPLT